MVLAAWARESLVIHKGAGLFIVLGDLAPPGGSGGGGGRTWPTTAGPVAVTETLVGILRTSVS